jgi:hypothetical protein
MDQQEEGKNPKFIRGAIPKPFFFINKNVSYEKTKKGKVLGGLRLNCKLLGFVFISCFFLWWSRIFFSLRCFLSQVVTTPFWDKCEDETHTPKSGKLESSGTLENSKINCKGQNTSH